MTARCVQPVLVLVGNEWRRFSCRQCENCRKGRKSDYVGRLLLEAQYADATFAFTNTYRPGEPGAEVFQPEDVQKFFRKLRDQYRAFCKKVGYLGPEITTPARSSKRRLRKDVSKRTLADRVRKRKRLEHPDYVPPKRYRGGRIRYMRISEWGQKFTKRHHLHGMLFLEGPKPDWERNKITHTNELWDVWPHGWSQVDYVPPDQAVKSANYIAKYMLKSAFDAHPPMGFSTLPALGTAGLIAIAEAYADAALPLREIYNVRNVRMSRGKHKGELRQFRMSGRARDHAFNAYRKRWIERKGSDENIPQTDWMLKYDPDAVFLKPATAPKMPWHKRPKRRPFIGRCRKAGTMAVLSPDGKVIGILSVSRRGVARFTWSKSSWGNEIVRGKDLRPYVDMSDAEHERVAKWLEEHRGPDWIDHAEYVALRSQARAQQDARLKYAAANGAAAIHDPAYFKARDVLSTMDGAILAAHHVKAKPRHRVCSAAKYARRHPERCRPCDLSLEPQPPAAPP